MKPLSAVAGKPQRHKYDVQGGEAKYWGTCHNIRYAKDPDTGEYVSSPKPFQRSDGSTSVDKTQGWHSRPGHKQALRNANRAITKRARQQLKRQMLDETL